MPTLLILITPCIALMIPFMSPATSILAVLALSVTLGIVMALLFFQTWKMRDHHETEAVAEDASKIAHAAFAALSRDPGASSASFRVKNGVVMHRPPTTGVPYGGDGSADAMQLENGSWSQYSWVTDGGDLESWPDLFYAGKRTESSGKRLGGFWSSVRSVDGSDSISQMV